MTRSRSNAVAVSTIDHEAREAAESERALLGALMLDSAAAWPQIKDVVGAQHFARADHRFIFGAISALIEQVGRADLALVLDQLTDSNDLENAGGREYLAEMVLETTSAANAAAYASVVREHADRKKVVNLSEQIAARARVGGAADAIEHAKQVLATASVGGKAKPLQVPPALAWASQPIPPPREWILEPYIPAGRVTSLFGVGGLGKTLLALQIGLHTSLGRSLFDVPVKGGPVLGIFCEDESDELNRRVRAACAAERIEIGDVDRFYAVSRDGEDSILCTFDHDHIQLTAFYWQLDATIEALKPVLVILDTAADLFAGDFMSTPHVRQFIKIALGGLCVRHGCAVLLLAHPSKAGEASGEGDGFSTAWSNSVRSRLYLSRPKVEGDEPPEAASDRRVLEVKKSNYGTGDARVPLVWDHGTFLLDREPLGGVGTPRTKTARVSLAALDYIRSKNPLVAGFRELFESLQSSGALPSGSYEEHRKPLNRALRQLIADGMVVETRTPRGYRLNSELR